MSKWTIEEMTADAVRELLDYDRITGIFVWKQARPRVQVGAIAGWRTDKGYIRITVGGRSYYASQLAWLHVNGVWPQGELDHRDLNKSNNAIDNLRPATNQQNQWNRSVSKASSLGVKGVCPKAGGFVAQIRVAGAMKHIAFCRTIEAAKAAYDAEALRLRGEWARNE